MNRQTAKLYRNVSRGFTLVELLVVMGIIALLIALLFPALRHARIQAMQVACQSNLREIYSGTRLYANDYKDHFPDFATIGNFYYRMAPGQRTPGDHSALPELYGLQAILHGIGYRDDLSQGIVGKGRYLDAASKVWVCPAEPDYMQGYGNTYMVSGNAVVGTDTSVQRGRAAAANTPFVNDNWAFYPALTGFRGPFTGYTIPSNLWASPHVLRTDVTTNGGHYFGKGAANYLYLDGHTDIAPIIGLQ